MTCKHLINTILIFSLLVTLTGCAGKSAHESRFVDLGNGICQDTVSGIMFQKDRSKTIRGVEGAREYVSGLSLGGHQDWRLPTIYELYDINYVYDLHQGDGCPIEKEGSYWSDELDGEGMVGAWEISDQCEPERHYFANTKGYVRAIRP